MNGAVQRHHMHHHYTLDISDGEKIDNCSTPPKNFEYPLASLQVKLKRSIAAVLI